VSRHGSALQFLGYTAPDPLDRASTAQRIVLTIAVSEVVTRIFLSAQSALLHVVTYLTHDPRLCHTFLLAIAGEAGFPHAVSAWRPVQRIGLQYASEHL
jgi:hypothetical protein